MVLVFAAFALVGTDILKLSNIKDTNTFDVNSQVVNMALTILVTVFTLVVNYGISVVNSGLTRYEQHKTRTEELTALIVKMLISQFINTAFIYYLITKINYRPLMS